MSVNIQLDNAVGSRTIPVAGQSEFHKIWMPIARKYDLKFLTDIGDFEWYQFDWHGLLKLTAHFIMFKVQLENKSITSGDEKIDHLLIESLTGIIDSLEGEKGNEKVTGNIG